LETTITKRLQNSRDEELYIGTAGAEHIEMYLKAIWSISESKQEVKIKKGNIVELTSKGNRIGKQMIRNTRLLEVMMKDALKIEIDEEMVCGIEHHMKKIFTDALCTLLKHPRECPHGNNIPYGQCCR
jgi:DtxR family transcriptional regulator, Mn-dependent transcriptional regulator